MVHTAQLVSRLSKIEYHSIFSYMVQNKTGKTWYKGKGGKIKAVDDGFTWIRFLCIDKFGLELFIIRARVNLAKLSGGGSGELLKSLDTDKLEILSHNFQAGIMRLIGSERLSDISQWNVKRIDWAVDIETENTEKYIRLFQKGDIIRMGEKPLTTKSGHSVQDKNGSFKLNVYDKNSERKARNPEDAARWENILRFELQCNGFTKILKEKNTIKTAGGVYALVKGLEDANRSLASMLINSDIHERVGSRLKSAYFYKAGCTGKREAFETGDYYTKAAALRILEDEKKQMRLPSKSERTMSERELDGLIRLLNEPRLLDESGEYKSLREFGEAIGRQKLRKMKSGLTSCGINPILIPDKWGVEHLPNISEKFLKEVEIYYKK